MLQSNFVEDIFIEFYSLAILLQKQDQQPAESFYNLIIGQKLFTQNQANFLVKILRKYQPEAFLQGLDYSTQLKNPLWKNTFRVLDLEKKLLVEKDQDGELHICVKFPYSLKEVFDKEILPVTKDYSSSSWDADKKHRKLKFYNYNLIEVYEFAVKHNFQIEDSFLSALAKVEEIWQFQDNIIPQSVLVDNSVVLANCNEDTQIWWNENSTGDIKQDLLLAKSMGFPYAGIPTNTIEKIASTDNRDFWIKSNNTFFELYKDIGGPVAVIVSKGESSIEWVKQLVNDAVLSGVPTTDIRVCFRLSKDENGEKFNQWVRDNNLGGPVDSGKIFIFQAKPPKWLFSQEISVKLILTNSLYPIPSGISQAWMNNHSCVCYVGEFKAANAKERQIVEL
jgi:hypothetical protein